MATPVTISRATAMASVVALLLLAACVRPSDGAFFNRGDPEALLDVSSEVVNLGIENKGKIGELSSWIKKDQPTRAELYCIAGDPRCNEARKVLELNAVPVSIVPSNENTVALVYERILARDCNQRYTDNTPNPYNASAPAFGCAVAANIVQHVSDKQEFVNPNLSDTPSSAGAVDAYGRAYAPKTVAVKQYSVGDSLAAKAKSN